MRTSAKTQATALWYRYEDIELNEVLWITPETCYLPESPGGFALRVDEILGGDRDRPGNHRMWVRGPVLLRTNGPALRILTLYVPVDHPRAVPADQAAGSSAPPHDERGAPTDAIGVYPSASGAHRAGCQGRDTVEHAGRRYRRVL